MPSRNPTENQYNQVGAMRFLLKCGKSSGGCAHSGASVSLTETLTGNLPDFRDEEEVCRERALAEPPQGVQDSIKVRWRTTRLVEIDLQVPWSG